VGVVELIGMIEDAHQSTLEALVITRQQTIKWFNGDWTLIDMLH
jgi:hypothetical protein